MDGPNALSPLLLTALYFVLWLSPLPATLFRAQPQPSLTSPPPLFKTTPHPSFNTTLSVGFFPKKKKTLLPVRAHRKMSSAGYGQVSSPSRNAGQKKKKLAIIGGSAVILLCMVVGAAVGVSRYNSSKGGSSNGNGLVTTSKAIKSICQPTDYKEMCESSLTQAAGNTSDPKVLVEVAFNVTINHIREAFNHSLVLQAAAKDPRTSEALEDCKELLDYAINELRNSFNKFGQFEISKIDDIIDDLKIWLSAAVTYQETCLDGFANVTGDAAESMRKALNSSQALTSNSLAIIDEISSVLSTLQIPFLGRRLFSEEEADNDEFPSWVTDGKRRLLALATDEIKPDIIVAQDGSGNYKTINEALYAIPKNSESTFVIYIKEGVYKEQVWLNRSMTNVMMIGDGPTKTTITGNLNFIDGTTTFKTATFGKQFVTI